MFFLPKNRTTRMPDNDDGFSLIEVILAVSVLAIGLLAISSLSISSSRSNGRSTRYTQAVTLAETQVENLLNTPYDTMGDSGGPTVVDTRYTISWAAESPDNGVRKITVTTTWPEGNLQRSVDLVFYKHEDI